MNDIDPEKRDPSTLRRGWTTGACATAAAKAAYQALLTGTFPDPVEISLPRGESVGFTLAREQLGSGWARAGIIKDAGDDPDVTHGALILATVAPGTPGGGVSFAAGEGVGMVTKPGLPIDPGEPAINPVPRSMIREAIGEVARDCGGSGDVTVTISIPDGARLALKTWNPRLGIVGGLSILGTTGIVRPFSCSAWIASIHRGIDVARANSLDHVLASTGATSEQVARNYLGLSDLALLDMGDFAGGVLKYLRSNPIDRLTIAGGFAKLTKLAQGALDLHSGRSQVDFEVLAQLALDSGGDPALANRIRQANTASHALEICEGTGVDIASAVALTARNEAQDVLRGAEVSVDVMLIDRQGNIRAKA